MFKPNIDNMHLAIKMARKNIQKMDGGPFGACIVNKKGLIISVAKNNVLRSDATSHAEINAIRKASKKLKTYDLKGCIIYSTTEPCPMCFSAIHWAGIKTIVFGTNITDAAKIGFNEMPLSNKKLATISKTKVKIISGFCHKDCLTLFTDWNNCKNKKLY